MRSLKHATTVDLSATPVGASLSDAARAAALSSATGGASINAAVVDADASSSAWIAAGLEQAGVSEIVFGPDATSPTFADVLTGPASGTAQGTLVSEGISASDISSAPSVVSYLSALRLLAYQSLSAQPDVAVDMSLSCFAQSGAATADVRSNDAVMALAAAARKAGSTTPLAIRRALDGGLDATAADGLAGPALRFGAARTALPADAVMVRFSADVDPSKVSADVRAALSDLNGNDPEAVGTAVRALLKDGITVNYSAYSGQLDAAQFSAPGASGSTSFGSWSQIPGASGRLIL